MLAELRPGGVTIEEAEVQLLRIARTLLDLQLHLCHDPTATRRVEGIPAAERWQWHKLAEDASYLGQRATVQLPPLSHDTVDNGDDGRATIVLAKTTIAELEAKRAEHRKKRAHKTKRGGKGRDRSGSREGRERSGSREGRERSGSREGRERSGSKSSASRARK